MGFSERIIKEKLTWHDRTFCGEPAASHFFDEVTNSRLTARCSKQNLHRFKAKAKSTQQSLLRRINHSVDCCSCQFCSGCNKHSKTTTNKQSSFPPPCSWCIAGGNMLTTVLLSPFARLLVIAIVGSRRQFWACVLESQYVCRLDHCMCVTQCCNIRK